MMKKYIYIIIILFYSNLLAQNSTPLELSADLTGNKIIDYYLKGIGGEKKLKKIKTLQKVFKSHIFNTPDLGATVKVLYKTPNLYAFKLEIPEIGEIESTKYNGETCIVERNYNNQKTIRQIEGELLRQKIYEFHMFPILGLKNNNTVFTLIGIIEEENQKFYQVKVESDITSTFLLFFHIENFLLASKKIIENKTIRTTQFADYRKISGIWFPFTETTTIEFNGNIGQKTIKNMIEIKFNETLTIDQFQ